MDFSSLTRALDSLDRRNPPLNESIIIRAKEISNIISSTGGSSNNNNDAITNEFVAEFYLSGVLFLIETSQNIRSIKSSSKEQEVDSKDDLTKEMNVQEVDNDGCAVMETSVRWEPLAVGLFFGTELLNQQQQDRTTENIVESLTGTSNNKSSKIISSTNSTQVYVDGPRVPSMAPSAALPSVKMPILSIEQIETLCNTLHAAAMEHLEHREPRVRTLVAKAIGAYAKISGTAGSNTVVSIHNNHVGDMVSRVKKSIHDHIVSGRDESGNYSRSSEGALDDTTGWRALETNWFALSSLVSSISGRFVIEFGIDSDILQDCEFSSVKHVSRHVRAASMSCLEHMIYACAATAKEGDSHGIVKTLLSDPLSESTIVRATTVSVCRAGLADDWSQVRMSASVLCRAFLVTLNELGSVPDDVYPVLLPRMCLNRFYPAHGVKLYSHETWKIVFTTSGVPKIAENLPAICRYYVKMCDADNHAVREASCQAIAELVVRLGDRNEYRDKMKDYIELLLQALIMCFHDESWPVRDEACLACGIMCKAFPEECRHELNLLWARWSEQITDQIWSIREDAGVALGNALEAYGPEFMTKIKELMKEILPAAKNQATMTREEYKALSNAIESRIESQRNSGDDVAPKMRQRNSDGCSYCTVDRPKAAWEATDGCIYLIRELCRTCCPPTDGSKPQRDDILMSDNELKPLLQELADVCRVQHFPQSDDLRTTLWRNLPAMAEYIGKDRFKRHYLDIFMDLLFATLESRSASQLSRHAAGQCAEELASFVGTTIFRGRLEDYQREVFDRIMRERQMMPKGPGDYFSPFEPTGFVHVIQPKPYDGFLRE